MTARDIYKYDFRKKEGRMHGSVAAGDGDAAMKP